MGFSLALGILRTVSRRVGAFVGCLALVGASVAGCSGSGHEHQRTLTVFAAASLQQPFEKIARSYESAHPEVKVALSFDGSQNLVEQMVSGAPAGVLATANQKTMDRALKHGVVSNPTRFTANTLTLVVPRNNPAHVTGFNTTLDKAKLVICAPQVPCGAATQRLAKINDHVLKPVSEESKVSDVRGKVESGQADAGIVYRTDAKRAGDAVLQFPIPHSSEVVNSYPIAAATAHNVDQNDARAFIALVLSPEGQKILHDAGFGTQSAQ